jgi:DNA-binding transcriptional ArsR family regulator
MNASVLKFPNVSKASRRRAEDKWTPALVKLGYCTVPSILLWAQKRLKLTSEELNIVLHLADFWWDADADPHPSKDLLAGRMSMGGRQVQRHLTSLEKKGIVTRVARYRSYRVQTSNGYSMAPLVKELLKLEPEFRKEIELRKLRRKKLETKAN